MRRRIAIYGATEEALQLVPLLLENPGVEIAGVFDPEPAALRERLADMEPEVAESLRGKVLADAAPLAELAGLYAVVDSVGDFTSSFPEIVKRGVQVMTPLVARLLWCYGGSAGDHKGELLQALHEVVESYSLTVDADELFLRMLEIAMGVTGAEGGSLMLLDAEARELRVRVAVGVEPELWPKIRVPVGEGIAGRVVEEGRPLRLRGKADRQSFRVMRERLDVESALCVPLVHQGEVLGVLNLHHSTRPDLFSEDDLEFTEQLAGLDAQIIARAQEHEAMRSQASRYAATREVREILSARGPLSDRLGRLCRYVAAHSGDGIANVYLHDPEQGDLFLAATSVDGLGFGEALRIGLGQGIDGSVARTRRASVLRGPDGVVAYAALPLVAGDELAGVLSVQAGSGPAQAGEDMLLEVAAVAADEIAGLQREARLQARATKIGAINEAGIRIISETDPGEVLRLGTSSAAMVIEADHAILRLRDEDTGRFPIRSYFGSADGRLQEKLFKLDKRISVEALKRRGPVLVRDLSRDDDLRDFSPDVRSLVCAPLRRDGVAIGTLALYDKIAPERLAAGSFGDEDVQMLSRFTSYVERALVNARFHARALQFRSFDEETGLPNEAYLDKRLQEELARADGRPGTLAVAWCHLENLEEIERVRDPGFARKVVQRVAEVLRAQLRDFDVAGRTARDAFTILLPEPGAAASERVFDLARSVADDVAKDEDLNEPVRVALAFGYALHPEEGADRDTLFDRAREPRIRMV